MDFTIKSQQFPRETKEELEEQLREVFDRWCWETGSAEDKAIIDELDRRIAEKEYKRVLQASWTVEAQRELENDFGINLEDELAEILAAEIEKEQKGRNRS